ncbi:hypothetical protein F4780DRAFT_341643 [Xylariomycetidae sp. FL0641]|nr:hypothetical protein F4780DRAFT_341643 [Xylariomycetidae sp. FL0641]
MAPYLDIAEPADAARIAEIHMAAFSSNTMLLAQFPTPRVREQLQESIRLKALGDIADPQVSVLVVRDETEKQHAVMAFAKWSHPVSSDQDYNETPWIWPPCTDLGLVND